MPPDIHSSSAPTRSAAATSIFSCGLWPLSTLVLVVAPFIESSFFWRTRAPTPLLDSLSSGRLGGAYLYLVTGCAVILLRALRLRDRGQFALAELLTISSALALLLPLPGGALYAAASVETMVVGYLLNRRCSTVSEPSLPGEPSRGAYLVALLAISVAAAYLRFAGIQWGLPGFFHPDEARKVSTVRTMLQRTTLDPQYFWHPPALLYLTALVSRIFKWIGLYGDDTAVRILLAGRTVSVLAGTATVAASASIARRMYGRLAGLSAAGILAVLPLHVVCSRALKEDALLTMFVVLVALAVTSALPDRRSNVRWWAGAFVGLAAASKYSGVLSAVLLFVPALRPTDLVDRKRWARDGAIGLAVASVVFFCVSPYAVLRFHDFIAGVAFEGAHAAQGHNGVAISPWQEWWTFHLRRTLSPGVGVFPLVFFLLWLGGFRLKEGRLKESHTHANTIGQVSPAGRWLVITAFTIFYLAAEYARSKPLPQPDRYVLPCLPFLAIGAASALRCSTLRAPNGAVVALLCTTVTSLALLLTIIFTERLSPDTRQTMDRWIRRNLAENETVAMLGPSAYMPRLPNKFRGRTRFQGAAPGDPELLARLRASGYSHVLVSTFRAERFLEDGEAVAVPQFRDFDGELELVKRVAARWGSYGFYHPTLSLYRIRPAGHSKPFVE